MVEQRVCCDRCKAVILEGRTLLKVEAGPLLKRRETADLCADCSLQFEQWLSEPRPCEHRPAITPGRPHGAEYRSPLVEAAIHG